MSGSPSTVLAAFVPISLYISGLAIASSWYWYLFAGAGLLVGVFLFRKGVSIPYVFFGVLYSQAVAFLVCAVIFAFLLFLVGLSAVEFPFGVFPVLGSEVLGWFWVLRTLRLWGQNNPKD